jgi:hypothetical protein
MVIIMSDELIDYLYKSYFDEIYPHIDTLTQTNYKEIFNDNCYYDKLSDYPDKIAKTHIAVLHFFMINYLSCLD